jgi:membrane protein
VGTRLISRYLSILKGAFTRWNDHNATRLGASIAFYTLFSMAPLLLFVVPIVSAVFGQSTARAWILQEANQVAGHQAADTIRTLLATQRHRSGLLAGVIGIVTLLFGASGVFGELHDALNTIWEVPPVQGSSWKEIIKSRAFSFGMVLAVAFLLLVSLVISTALATVSKYFSGLVPFAPGLLELANFLFSLFAIACLFALIFKYVPDTKISWRDVWTGSVFTSLLFTIGKSLLGIYLGMAGIGSAYGAAGSVVAVVMWVYYSAQIFLYGAEVTWMYAKQDPRGMRRAAENKPATDLTKAAEA